MFLHYTLQLRGILQDFLLPRDSSHLSAERSKFRMPNFLLLGVFRRTLKIPGENPVLKAFDQSARQMYVGRGAVRPDLQTHTNLNVL